jgi:hypothetical protein
METLTGERVKQKGQFASCFSFQQKSWNRTDFHVFYGLTRFYTSLTDFTGFRVLNLILHVLCLMTRKIGDFTSQNSFLTTMIKTIQQF